MKRIFFLLALLITFSVQAQVKLPKGIVVGNTGSEVTLSPDELKTLSGATSNVQQQIGSKANSADVYTKTEVNNLVTPKANSADVYTKTETDALLTPKANTATTYTKTEVNNLVTPKANSADVYTKAQADAITNLKANSADVYLKTQTYTQAETNALVSPKANSADVYTKTETNNLLTPKANSADVYTKAQTDALVSPKANASAVYTKAEVDGINTSIQTELDTKMNISDSVELTSLVYLKAQMDIKLNMNPVMRQMLELTVPVKAVPMFSSSLLGGGNNMTDGRLNAVAYKINEPTTVTGVKYTQGTTGDYTSDNYNGVVLYSVSGTTLTEVTRTADDGTIWKKTASSIQTKDFPAPVTLQPGFYIVGSVWNASATVTAPNISSFGAVTNSSGWTPSGIRISGYLSTASPAATYVFGDFSNYTQLWGVWLY